MNFPTILLSFDFYFKGYVRLVTNFGPLNLELYCDVVPKTCENFIKHSANGYYNGTKFHRSIRNFMVSFKYIVRITFLLSLDLDSRWRSDKHRKRWKINLGEKI